MSDEINTSFFLKFGNAEKMFADAVRQTKKKIILQDEEEYQEFMGEYLNEKYELSMEDAEEYATLFFRIWEEKSFSSITAFDQEMSSLKKKLFKKDEWAIISRRGSR